MLYFSRWQSIVIWLVVLVGIAFAVPNLLPQSTRDALPDWSPKQPLTLGLDLRGGSHILLQVDRDSLLEDRLDTVRDDVRSLLRDERIGYTGLSASGTSVQVRIRDAGDIDAAKEALSSLIEPISTGVFGAGVINELEFSEPEPGLFRYTLSEEGITYRVVSAVSQSTSSTRRRG